MVIRAASFMQLCVISGCPWISADSTELRARDVGTDWVSYLALKRDCGRVHNRNVREQAIVMSAVLNRKTFVGLRCVAAGGELSVHLTDLHRQLTLRGKGEHHGCHVRRTTSSCAGLIQHHHFGLHPCSRHNSILLFWLLFLLFLEFVNSWCRRISESVADEA